MQGRHDGDDASTKMEEVVPIDNRMVIRLYMIKVLFLQRLSNNICKVYAIDVDYSNTDTSIQYMNFQ